MNERTIANLGAPDLAVMGFQLWVHNRSELNVGGDATWLSVTAHCGAHGASVWVSGEMLEDRDLRRFRDQAAAAHQTLSGDVVLESFEPNLCVRLTDWDELGNCRVIVEITPNSVTQSHRMTFSADQSLLPGIVAECDALLNKFPS
ncbi:MAG: hypothetical protein ABJC26_11670 [Gemmatimonadaceae bacterium]